MAQLGRWVVSSTRRPHFTPKEIPWYSFLLEASGPQGYWMRSEEIGHLKISKHHTENETRNVPSSGAEPKKIEPLGSSNMPCENIALIFPTENMRI